MSAKAPFDFSDMMKMFDPEQITKLFDPEQMKQAMDALQAPGLDLQAVIANNKKNYDAMVTANKAAADAYKDFYQMQLAIFNDLMGGARDHIASLGTSPDADAAKKQAKIYQAAAEKAFTIMTAFAEATKNANQDTFAVVQSRIGEAIEELKKT